MATGWRAESHEAATGCRKRGRRRLRSDGGADPFIQFEASRIEGIGLIKSILFLSHGGAMSLRRCLKPGTANPNKISKFDAKASGAFHVGIKGRDKEQVEVKCTSAGQR